MANQAQHIKIFKKMAERHANGTEWHVASDFVMDAQGNVFVGYEASARLSELAKDFPHVIETRWRGKFKERRIRVEQARAFIDELPYWIREALEDNGLAFSK
jgi:hypothetical protein